MLLGVSDVRRCCAQENDERTALETSDAPASAARQLVQRASIGAAWILADQAVKYIGTRSLANKSRVPPGKQSANASKSQTLARQGSRPPPSQHAPMFSGASQSSAGECTESANVRQKMTPSAAMQR